MDTPDVPDEGLPETPRRGRWFDRWTAPSATPPDPSVNDEGDVDGMPALRRAVAAVSPTGVIRTIAVRAALVRGTESVGCHRLLEVVVDADGNPAALSLQDALRADPVAARRIERALDVVDAWLDAEGYAGRDVTEVVLDADGAQEVRVAFGVEIAPEDVATSPTHPSVHDAKHHLMHRAPDLEALRDRLRVRRTPRLRRLVHRIRLVVTRSE